MQYINIRRLNAIGITTGTFAEYCNNVSKFYEKGDYFTIKSLHQEGFSSEIDNLGFEEWFYASVLLEDMTRKLTVDGLTKAYPVYKVRLDWIFYNDQNDRIATWISQYKTQHDGKSPDCTDRDAYNTIIEQFIVESNPDAIRKTQANIEMVDQREAGVVLADGRIIDGNRRFTCLRRLAKKNSRFGYFETAILDRDIENSAKQIKILELSIQHGEEGKVDYDPIDRLVSTVII